jgi:hypothetical protein
MRPFRRQARHREETPSSVELNAHRLDSGAVVVSVSAALADHLSNLTAALGPGFDVRIGPPQGPGVAVVSPQGTTAMAFYRLHHPRTALLVVGPCGGMAGQGPAEYLNAGADGYLAPAPPVVIAAHVRALARRQPLSQTPPAVRPVAV